LLAEGTLFFRTHWLTNMQGAPRNVGVIDLGQSNFQGASLNANGSGRVSGPVNFVSEYMGLTEPYPLNANGAGSCWPLLQDLGLKRGIRYRILNAAIGGARIVHFTGIEGATVTGRDIPLKTYNANGAGISSGTGRIPRFGEPDFDPYRLLARLKPEMDKTPQITDWVLLWANGESEGGTSGVQYTAALEALGDFAINFLGCSLFMPGFSAQGMLTRAKLNELSSAVDTSVLNMQARGMNVASGPNLFRYFNGKAPLYPEGNPIVRVHLEMLAQAVQAKLIDRHLEVAGH